MEGDSFLAAAVQKPPAILDLEASLARAVDAITEAGRAGARLVVFPETWLPAYPYFHPYGAEPEAFRSLFRRLAEHSVVLDSGVLDPVCQAAAEQQLHVVMGINERERTGGTLYNTLVYVAPDGSVLGRHRKLVPTLSERVVWGGGDGSDLDVYETAIGRLGGLICYEHMMAPARYALAGLGIQVHVSVWPGYDYLNPVVDAATRHLAYENACFVVVARDVLAAGDVPADLPLADRGVWRAHGGSAIIGPNGRYVTEPVLDEATIVYGEIDLARTIEAKRWVDAVGHYSRPDVFRLHWDRRPKPPVETTR